MSTPHTLKLIFLDVDGVSVNRTSLMVASGFKAPADPGCVAALNRIIEATGAAIVVSSTWRIAGLDWMKDKLAEWGVQGAVHGATREFCDMRGHEIGAYLVAHAECSRFVILDDDSDMGTLSKYLVQTEFELGLTEHDAKRAITVLGGLA